MIKRTLKQPINLKLDQPKMNKNNTIEEYTKQLLDVTEYDTVNARCYEVIVMNNKEYNEFKNNLLKNYKFLEGLQCGTGSDCDNIEKEHVWEFTEEEMNRWKAQSFRVATMIYNKDTDEKFYINTEGYSYARYCLFD